MELKKDTTERQNGRFIAKENTSINWHLTLDPEL